MKIIKEAMDDETIEKVKATLESEYTPQEQFIEAMILIRAGVDPEDIEFKKLGKAVGLSDLKTKAIAKVCQGEMLSYDELGVMILKKDGKPMTDMAAHALFKKAASSLSKNCKKMGFDVDIAQVAKNLQKGRSDIKAQLKK